MTDRIPKKLYEKELSRLQAELVTLQEWVRSRGERLVVVFEGRDAAGKGSTITRVRQYLNPRVARVAALPGAVSCDNKVLCRMAGKPFVVDEFKLDQMLAKGVATPAVIDEMLAARGISRFAADRRSWAYGVTQVASGKATAY